MFVIVCDHKCFVNDYQHRKNRVVFLWLDRQFACTNVELCTLNAICRFFILAPL